MYLDTSGQERLIKPLTTNGALSSESSNSEQDQRSLVDDFNATEDATTLGYCLPQLFKHTVVVYSDDIAVICGNEQLTYKQLETLTNGLTHLMVQEHGLQHGDIVGVALDRSIELIVTLLAIMKAGATYVPIDPAMPRDRVTNIMKNACPRIVMASDVTIQKFSSWDTACLRIEETWARIGKMSNHQPASVDLCAEDLAYIIYTSGSTGTPKGAETSHGALCNLLLSMRREPGCGPGDRLLAVVTVSFDISISDLLLPLVSGATLVIAHNREIRDPVLLLEMVDRLDVSIIQATPSFWQTLLDGGWERRPRLSKIVTAGEPLPRKLAERLLSHAESVWNAYGPSEATIYASIGRVSQDEKDVIIGDPIPNVQLYVLDAESLSPMPLGQLGELYIGGTGVNCGYHNNPELTSRSFLDNPFHGGTMYRTGDLARFIAPGKLSLVGRADSQVKVRGFRIELGDVESAITDHNKVSAAVVVNKDDQLVAYCKRDENVETVSDTLPALDDVLRPWLAERRPSYMIPSFFVEVDAFPTTANGKVDRKALPDPMKLLTEDTSKAKPRTALEHSILSIWSRVLGHNHIGIDDNFFQIGGNSIRVPKVKTELETTLNKSIPAAKLFELYTIKHLAGYLENSQNFDTRISHQDSASLKVKDWRRPLHCSANYIHEDIAIVSMSCRLPGGISSPEDFWQVLEQGRDCIVDVPKDRWDADTLYHADADSPGKSYCKRGGFLADGIDSFDAQFFGISPREAKTLDAVQHLTLETCYEALERAGYTKAQIRGSQTGVFIGQSNITSANVSWNVEELDGYSLTGTASAALSGRVSYILGLEGPSLTLDTACSSSLVSTHLACTALRQRECDYALAGGVTLLSPEMLVEFSRLKGLSVDGRCRAFSADTNGTGLSEGSAVVMLRRLSDAQRDGDFIHAVLRGSAVNHGGRCSANLTVPSMTAQERLIRTAQTVSGLRASDIDYVEAHGTATRLGDPIEGTALAEVFKDRLPGQKPLQIASAKSNLGHTQAAAGLAGVLKVVLAMQHDVLPRSLHITEPTPLVDWRRGNMEVVLKNQPWDSSSDRPRRAGVSSFGIGGTNAHLIVEEAPSLIHPPSTNSYKLPLPHMLPFLISGQSDAAVRQQADRLRRRLLSTNIKNERRHLGDISYSLAVTRDHFRQRVILLADSKADLTEKLASVSSSNGSERLSPVGTIRGEDIISGNETCLALLFTGQGSQTLGMGKELYRTYSIVRETFEEIAAHFTNLNPPLLDVMWADEQSKIATLIHQTKFAQPAIFALEVALWRLWQSWGVKPKFLLGHSVGELAAAHVAGVLSLSDACRLVQARGQLMQEIASNRPGRMASIGLSVAEVESVIKGLGLDGTVEVAGQNTPKQTVISGNSDAVQRVVNHFIVVMECKVKPLDVSCAFHSHHMDAMLPQFHAIAETLHFNPPKLTVISSLTGRIAEKGELERPDYWVQQARRAVRFGDGIYTASQEGVGIFVELGPQPVLSGMTADCLGSEANEASSLLLPSLKSGKVEDTVVLQTSLAQLHVRHVTLDWSSYFAHFDCRRVQLPTYAFQRERYNWHRHQKALGTTISNGVYPANKNETPPVGRCQFEIEWCRVNTPNVQKDANHWGLLCPSGNVSWAFDIKSALSQAGIQVTIVQDLHEAKQLDGLMCLWDDASEHSIPERAHKLATKALVQLQTAAAMNFDPMLVWITREATSVSAHESKETYEDCTGKLDSSIKSRFDEIDNKTFQGLCSAPLYGLFRTARYEHPELKLRLVDLEKSSSASGILPSALMLAAEESECAIRGGQLLRPQIKRAAPSISHGESVFRSDGAILVTGGLGGIGQHVARWLASKQLVQDIVLTSRSGNKAPGAEALLSELAGHGAKAAIISCDVGNYESLRSALGVFGGERPLGGIIHCAGAVDNGILSSLTPERFAATFEPKVSGAWNLHRLTRDIQLDYFMMFSSISGVLGMPGLGNYAAANTFLDALAQHRRSRQLPATSVAFGVWAGDGMGAETKRTTRAHLAQFGLDPLAPEDGLLLLEQSVQSERALTVAAALDLKRLRKNLLDNEQGGIPLFYRDLLSEDEGLLQAEKSDNVQHDQIGGKLPERLSKIPSERHQDVVLSLVHDTVAKALGFTSVDQVDVNVPLQDLGFDSLTAVLLRNQLAKVTDLKTLSASDITWKYPNLRALSEFLLVKLQEEASAIESSLNDSGESLTNGLNPPSPMRPAVDIGAIRKGCLDPALAFENAKTPRRPSAVFITGATGFVGAFVLSELLRRGINTHCLVRASGIEHGMDRLTDALKTYDLWEASYESLIHPIIGNIAEPLFGLPEDSFNRLANDVDAICHAGALVDWMRPLDDYIGPNLMSTHEVLRLASRGHRSKAVHVVSTLATLPHYLGHEVTEQDREYGYSTTKYMAERMVGAARWRGLNASVYRVPFVTASGASGHFRRDRGDFLHNLIAGSLDMGGFPFLKNSDLEVVLPVDYLSETIVDIMVEDRERIGADFDFRNANALSCDRYFRLMGNAAAAAAERGDGREGKGPGYNILPFREWQRNALDYASAHPKSPLARIATVVDGLTEETAPELIKGLPPGQHVLGGNLYPAPVVDEQLVQRYFERVQSWRTEA